MNKPTYKKLKKQLESERDALIERIKDAEKRREFISATDMKFELLEIEKKIAAIK